MSTHYLLVFACLWGFANAHPSKGNLAATIRATQSSLEHFLGEPRHAIDGNENTDYNVGSCSRTRVQRSPWWRVDFFYHYHVYVVEITTSRDGGGLTGAEIRIGDSLADNGNKNKICAKIESIPAGATQIFKCAGLGVHGRYLTIHVPDKVVALSLCEVKAFGAHEPHDEHEH
ncbi:fucolectin-1-like [Cetorhinus maximus]